MKITRLETESALLGLDVLKIDHWDSVDEILSAERDFAQKDRPAYVFCQVDATDLPAIHALEDQGYRFSEFRIKSSLHTGDTGISTRSYYPFGAELITEQADLAQAVEMLRSARQDDRFSNDPALGTGFSRKRVEANLEKSFRGWPDEFLLGLYNTQRGELVAFRSGAFLSKTEAHYYQYGIRPGMDPDHTSAMLEAFTIEYLSARGVKIISVISTGFNTPELNRLLKSYDFRIEQTQVLMRKVFGRKAVGSKK